MKNLSARIYQQLSIESPRTDTTVKQVKNILLKRFDKSHYPKNEMQSAAGRLQHIAEMTYRGKSQVEFLELGSQGFPQPNAVVVSSSDGRA